MAAQLFLSLRCCCPTCPCPEALTINSSMPEQHLLSGTQLGTPEQMWSCPAPAFTAGNCGFSKASSFPEIHGRTWHVMSRANAGAGTQLQLTEVLMQLGTSRGWHTTSSHSSW